MKKFFAGSVLYFLIILSYTSMAQGPWIEISTCTAICKGERCEASIIFNRWTSTNFEVTWTSTDKCLTDPKKAKVIVCPETTTTYCVEVIDKEDNNKKYSACATIIVIQPVQLSAGPDDSSMCAGVTVQLYANVSNAKGGEWKILSGGGTLVYPTPPYTNSNYRPKYVPATGFTGTAKLEFTAFGLESCPNKSVVCELNFFNVPNADVTITGTNKNICTNGSSRITGLISGSYTSYKWSKGTGKGILKDEATLNPTYYAAPGDKGKKIYITLNVYNEGCLSFDRDSIQVYDDGVEILEPMVDNYCEGTPASLSVNVPADCTIEWFNGKNTRQIEIIPNLNTVYWVKATFKSGCTLRDTIDLPVLESPDINLEIIPQECKIIAHPENYAKYKFYKGGTIYQEGRNNIFNFCGLTVDTVSVEVTNTDGCSSKRDTIVDVEPVDAFSPNADGINDRLLPGYKIIVFDRTSKILYQGRDGWDGIYNGKEMPVGTYFYILYKYDNTIKYKGPVVLVR